MYFAQDRTPIAISIMFLAVLKAIYYAMTGIFLGFSNPFFHVKKKTNEWNSPLFSHYAYIYFYIFLEN